MAHLLATHYVKSAQICFIKNHTVLPQNIFIYVVYFLSNWTLYVEMTVA